MDQKQRMFQNPFSIRGRIRRLEYGISYLIYMAYYMIVGLVTSFMQNGDSPLALLFFILMLPAFWFMIAQGTKRCHDRDNSGWYQIIPFYGLVMLFGDGDYGENDYGYNPKGLGNEDIDEMINEIGTPEQ
ncbi:DUF805 domain-containing protein [Dysgonomonas sp. 521]|uniref:DUF805 domain-containing protein n=1 Tax=Dysgonomonas sp. 521 TaxID=2302932 RepID=UPI0013D8D6BF|nr:DUF805 domain-containing protein [Dysgonomonas sp. 521]NDV95010.1 DUF805 domain-containing protein [Dysgonomonas sp. 521]